MGISVVFGWCGYSAGYGEFESVAFGDAGV